jgi:anaerobic magnesium-protoporphyrin IX monomethyl ester cyclase
MIEQRDLVLVTVPFTDTPVPLYAIAQLKSVAQEAGWNTCTIDFNNIYVNELKWHRHSSAIVDWFYNEKYHPGIESFILSMLDKMSDDIIARKPKMVGISLFTYACQIVTKYLCIALRKKDPTIKIVLGGSGIYDNVLGDSNYIDGMREMNLVDHHFVGDAELSFYDFLKGEREVVGMDSNIWKELDNQDLEEIPYANFEDYDWKSYKSAIIPMTASRGCVRRCTFCSDIAHWKLFSFRTGQHIFDEMLHHINKYGYRHFSFTDALINGNVKEFRNLLRLLSDYNAQNPDDMITWESQFIFRPQRQFTEDDWILLKGSNPKELYVGIESLCPDVRYDMGKKFDQADMNFNFEMALKYDINMYAMMIVGYPTEDEKSIQTALDWLTNNTHFQPIIEFSWGGTMAVLPGTYLDDNREKYGLDVYGPPWQLWKSDISGSTPKKRLEWYKQLTDHCKKLGYKTSSGIENTSMIHLLENIDEDYRSEYKNDKAFDVQNYKDFHDQLNRLQDA